MARVDDPVRSASSTKDVSNLERGRIAQPSGVLPPRDAVFPDISPAISAISRSSGLATAWVVRLETFV